MCDTLAVMLNPPRSRLTMIAVTLALSAAVVGCPGKKKKSPAQAARCAKAYEQCQLPDGPLGVCSPAPCTAGQSPPCLECLSQH